LKELIKHIVQALVDHPEQVAISEVEGKQSTLLEIKVATVLDDLAHLFSQKESVQGEELGKMLLAATPGMATSSPVQPSRNITGKGDNENGI